MKTVSTINYTHKIWNHNQIPKIKINLHAIQAWLANIAHVQLNLKSSSVCIGAFTWKVVQIKQITWFVRLPGRVTKA